MRIFVLMMFAVMLTAANVHHHGVVEPYPVQPSENATIISLSNDIVFDTRLGEPQLPREFTIQNQTESGYFLIQVKGPVYSEWIQELKNAGINVIGYLPQYALIVHAQAEQLNAISNRSFVQWIGVYQPAYKVQKELFNAQGTQRITIQLFPIENTEMLKQQLVSMGFETVEVIDHKLCKTIDVIADLSRISDIAQIPAVHWIQLWSEATLCNDNCQWVTQRGWSSSVPSNPGARPVWFAGVVGQGTILCTTDTGIRTTHYAYYDAAYPITAPGTFPNHRKIVAYKLYQGANFGDDATNGYHGSHVNCTVAGNDTLLGSSNYDGMAKWGRLYFVDVANASGGLVVSTNLTAMYDTIHLGRNLPYTILQHSGSWGWGNSSGTYLLQDASTDAYIYAHPDFLNLYAAGNESSTRRIRNPGIAKNILTIGATLNSTNSTTIAPFSSRGPTLDNRYKPNIVAPGDGMSSYTGLWSANGAGDTGYKQMAGTSMATPASNGTVGLIRQYLLAGYYPTGSANTADSVKYQSCALLRAMAMVSGDPNVGSAAVPNNDIGWGRIDLDSVLYFAGDTRKLIILDDTIGVTTGTSIRDSFQVNSAIPIKVCLAWTDTAAAASANPTLINNLHLELTAPGGTFYRGNQYTSGYSTPNPAAWDNINVEECCRVNTPATGKWYIRVVGQTIPNGPMGFAYAITGDINAINPGVIEDNSRVIGPPQLHIGSLIIKDRLNFALSLDANTQVKANIVDISGRVVSSVINSQLSAGEHQFSIPHNLANGVYFFFISTENSHQIEKLVVVR